MEICGSLYRPKPSIVFPVFKSPYSIIGNFLGEDVGPSRETCKFYLSWLARGENLLRPKVLEGNGNTVVLSGCWTAIFSKHDISVDMVVPTSALLEIIEYWERVLDAVRRNDIADELLTFHLRVEGGDMLPDIERFRKLITEQT